MLQFVLDSDHLTLFDHGNSFVTQRMALHAGGVVGLPAVVAEEQLRGRLAQLGRARDGAARIARYALFLKSLRLVLRFPIAPFDQAAEDQFQLLRAMRLRFGTRDQKIAVIALANNLVLVTRNMKDFGQIPGLAIADWSI